MTTSMNLVDVNNSCCGVCLKATLQTCVNCGACHDCHGSQPFENDLPNCPCSCDDGKIFNNADQTSNQWVACDQCKEGKGL